MKGLSNAHPLEGGTKPRYVGFASNIIPESKNLPKGVSSNFVPLANHYWFVFRVTYNQVAKASNAFNEKQIITYFPQHYVWKNRNGKKKRVLAPLLPNFIFAYTTRNKADNMVRNNLWTSTFIKYYLDKTKERESNGFHPPLTIGFNEMMNFILATNSENEHIMTVTSEMCHFKSGDTVKVIDGDFKGVIGRVARVAGQQRVIIEIEGLCMIATAYVPSAFIELLK